MKQNDFFNFKTSFLLVMIGVLMMPQRSQAQSINTKYRIKQNSTGLYLGFDGNAANAAVLANFASHDAQIWYLLETENIGTYFIKNDEGSYLGRESGANWWETEVYSSSAGTGFNEWTVTQVGSGSTYLLANTSIGDGSMGTDNGDGVGNYVYDNKSGADAEWEFEAVTPDFISWNGTAWSNGTGPASTDDVLVNGALSITADITVNNLIVTRNGSTTISSGTVTVDGGWENQGSLIVESGASLMTYEIGYAWGSVTVNRNSSFTDAEKQYSFIGAPVSGYMIEDLSAGYHYTYNTSDDSYSIFTGEMIAGVGYTSAGKEALAFTGKPNVGDKTVALDFSGNGFNFVANPYPAAISRTLFASANNEITGAIYLWDDGGSDDGQRPVDDFVTVTNAGSVGGSGGSGASFDENTAIGSAQGFLVQTDGAFSAGDVIFNEGMRVSGENADGSFFRSSTDVENLVLEVKNETKHDQIMIAFTAEGTNRFDRLWDANKFTVNTDLSIYSKQSDGANLAIQTLPVLKSLDEEFDIALGTTVAESGDYTFDIPEVNLSDGKELFLVDKFNGEVYSLAQPLKLALAPDQSDRFSLRIAAASVLSTGLSDVVKFYVSEGEMFLENTPMVGESTFAVYDLAGSLKSRGSLHFDQSGQAKLDLTRLQSGIYAIRVANQNGQFSMKFNIQ